ncbi:MAG: HDOD domain-containing protein, partial [Pseudomonadota bacterium]|nr:HDOD domain-containing protein [Pseudomonadota bacterium]
MTGQLIQQTREDIEGMIARDELILPTLPEIALKVRDIAEDENASIQDMARALTKDPALSARLLRVTNSPMVRTMVPITDVT